jgi:hypothetical protein
MQPVAAHAGWRHLHHADHFDIMLFDPRQHPTENSYWPLPPTGKGGAGIEIVLTTTDIGEKRLAVQALGYACSELLYPPWASTEFTFQLAEGYLLRIKQPQS